MLINYSALFSPPIQVFFEHPRGEILYAYDMPEGLIRNSSKALDAHVTYYLLEKQSNCDKKFILKGDRKTLHEFYSYASNTGGTYAINANSDHTLWQIGRLLVFADFYQIDHLRDLCCDDIVSNFWDWIHVIPKTVDGKWTKDTFDSSPHLIMEVFNISNFLWNNLYVPEVLTKDMAPIDRSPVDGSILNMDAPNSGQTGVLFQWILIFAAHHSGYLRKYPEFVEFLKGDDEFAVALRDEVHYGETFDIDDDEYLDCAARRVGRSL